MNKLFVILIAVSFICFSCRDCKKNEMLAGCCNNAISEEVIRDSVPLGAQVLIDCFPDYIDCYEDNKLVFFNGEEVTYDDGIKKSYTETLDNCDVEDMFQLCYNRDTIPQYLFDVGRGRSEQLYKALYGSNPVDVTCHLAPVIWFGQKIMFTSVNNANRQLEKVADELSHYPEYHKYLTNASTFYWRKVRGANRLSAHSYGIAIDINTKYSNYWLWENGQINELSHIDYVNRIPNKIVEVFEKHGFIWGGSWYHFDTMHFEYRPELINYANLARTSP